MFARSTIRTGLALAMTAGIIAGGPAIADGLGVGQASPVPVAHSAGWEAEQGRNAANAVDSNAAVLKAKARAEAERKRIAAEKAARKAAQEAAREAARKRAQAAAARSRARAATTIQGGTPASNRALGMQLCANMGWSSSQCADLGRLWEKESGWNHRAENRSSGAYGIPQALPGSKMGTVAADWRTNPATQIKWGLSYIKGRYGSPSNAWAHSQRVGWY